MCCCCDNENIYKKDWVRVWNIFTTLCNKLISKYHVRILGSENENNISHDRIEEAEEDYFLRNIIKYNVERLITPIKKKYYLKLFIPVIFTLGYSGVFKLENTASNIAIYASDSNGDIIMRAGGSTSGENAIVAVHHGEVVLSFNGNTKLTTTNTGINVTGLTDTDTLTTGDATFTGTITAGGSTGNNGQYLKSTGTGVAWENYPAARTATTYTATAGQTTFAFNYNVGYLDVFVNGVKLTASEKSKRIYTINSSNHRMYVCDWSNTT